MPNTGLSIIGGISPYTLPRIITTDSIFDGFLPRFLFLHIDNEPFKYSKGGLDCKFTCYWESLIEFSYNLPLYFDENNRVKSRILRLDDKALDIWIPFVNSYKKQAVYIPEIISCFLPKLITYSLKFAGILHIIESFMKGTIDNNINDNTINSAVKLTRFYAGQAVKLVKLYDLEDLDGFDV